MPEINYRRDIDGLRAIAVLIVIFYHLDFSLFSGGFIGVDVFFVISGFLITKTIQQDIRADKFTFTRFYVKRIRRIIPALFVTTLTTLIISLYILPVNELKELLASIVSVATFTSNIFFWQHVDYFSTVSDLKPLLHTWSLGIEEQFYLLFPVFMFLTVNLKNNSILFIVLILLASSFALGVSPLAAQHPSANFFLPATRFWELLAGTTLAFIPSRFNLHNIYLKNSAALMGLLIIALGATLLSYKSLFPGINALYPVVGAMLIIHSGKGDKTLIAAFLSIGLIRYIGLISFSLYLWHWPIIALLKNVIFGELTITTKLSALTLTFVLSALSYRFVEQPFRTNQRLKETLHIKSGLIALGSLGAIAIIILLFIFFRAIDQGIKPTPMNKDCFKDEETIKSSENCSFGDIKSNRIFLLFGDSHAAAMYPAFHKLALDEKWRGIIASIDGCPPLFGIFRLDGIGTASNCSGVYADNVKTFVTNNKELIEAVFLTARWPIYEKGAFKNGRLLNETHFLSDQDMRSENAADSSKVLLKALRRTVNFFNALKIRTIIIEPPPKLNLFINSWRERKDVPRTEFIKKRLYLHKALNKLPLVEIIDPINIFCPTERCKMYDAYKPLYTDDNHVSRTGALLFYPLLKSVLNQPPKYNDGNSNE
ncbi:acyltransferase family protein [Cycloclasticus zancles]|uniref:Acyltransferase n=1 Tax=Cycloclasticus zancles 78-ME TaxID=1198232 RepID=S5T7J5_9GAMM|nr:acyltransferase family protein [Cycloclasticus zancles]AGS39756.1 Acyltransferase [Cycloclasticus zancles 78-ME]|tara:strand:+ start:1697 stop:3658 length:1962 start_codon:yes stop_codon:yes gene_type:complete